LYENALVLELRALGHVVEQQRGFPVMYRQQLVGTLIPDLIVDGSVIVDTKTVNFVPRYSPGPNARILPPNCAARFAKRGASAEIISKSGHKVD
jgi:hypothetical protein